MIIRDFNSRHVLFDTNALLDIVDDSRPGSYEACLAVRHCNGGGDMGLATAGSFKDAYYILRKLYGAAWAIQSIRALLDLLVVLPLEGEACVLAATSNEPDFEDGLIRAAAELNDVDFILTRDARAFRNSTIRAITCEEYLRIVAED